MAIAFFVSGPRNACGSAALRWDCLNLRSNHNYPPLQGQGFKETKSPALFATALAIQARFILMVVQNLWNEKFVCKNLRGVRRAVSSGSLPLLADITCCQKDRSSAEGPSMLRTQCYVSPHHNDPLSLGSSQKLLAGKPT